MNGESYSGYVLNRRLPAGSATVEYWQARRGAEEAEVYLGSEILVERAKALASWGPFAPLSTGRSGNRWYVIVPGCLQHDLTELRSHLSPCASLGFAWQLASALADLHAEGGVHGALHTSFTGIGPDGKLSVRPALAMAMVSEPDPHATEQATDCLQLAALFDSLHLDRLEDPRIPLLLSGLRRESARLRLQPGRAIRQVLSALLKRWPQW